MGEQALYDRQFNDYRGLKDKYTNIIQPKVKKLISKFKLPYFEMSCKTGDNVVDTFIMTNTALLRNIFQAHKQAKKQKSSGRNNKKPKQASFRYQREESLDTRDCDFSKHPSASQAKSSC